MTLVSLQAALRGVRRLALDISAILKMPDAIVLGTAIAHRVEAIVHGDDEWATRATPYASTLKLIYLGDHCP